MKSVVVLGLARLSVPEKIEKARFIVMSMGGNSNFPSPSPPINTIATNANALEAASIAAMGGGVDDTANMRSKEVILDLSLKSLAGYVEGIANATPLSAEAIILSAGMDIKGRGVRTKQNFEVSVTKNPGEVKLIHKGVTRCTYEFQMSTDITSEDNWETIHNSTRGSCLKSGLISGTRYYFRAAVVDKNGQSPWSQVISSIAL